MLKSKFQLAHFALILSVFHFLFFHLPFYQFVFKNVVYTSLNGVVLIGSLVILMLVLNTLVFYILMFLLRFFGKILFVLFFIINAIAVYFIQTYGVIIDETMIGNVFNTNYEEASSFFSIKLMIYLILLAIIPAIWISKAKIQPESWKKFLTKTSVALVFVALLVFANASNWLWIDKNSKTLGGLAMPWSYTVNTVRYFNHKSKQNEKEIRLPDATLKNNEKSVFVLVIGESARSENFSLYGYPKNTNPLLSKTEHVFHFKATSCATYTTAGIKCIVEHASTNSLYEILPNYLYRNNIEVIWRTTNWGEPPLHIQHYQNKEFLAKNCKGENCEYDEVLLTGLKEQIVQSDKNKILIVLHTSTSHGPQYSKKYPAPFEVFSPVCNSVELGNCTQNELMNAYDNTIVYTDYLLHQVIETLKQLPEYKSAMLFVSDHGESLGEKNLYMHGVPISIAPKEQYEIPFIVWFSDRSTQLKPYENLTQNHVFHSVLHYLDVQSPVYQEEMNIFK